MRVPHLALLLLPLASLVGCASPEADPAQKEAPAGGQATPWDPMECDPSPQPARSGNAPLVPAFADTDEALAQAIAAALDDRIVRLLPEDVDDLRRWETEGGEVQVSTHESGWRTASYSTFHGGLPSASVTREALVRLGADPAALSVEDDGDGYGNVEQTWQGQPLEGTGASWMEGEGDPAQDGWWGSIDFDLLHDLPDPEDTTALPAAGREVAARAYADCSLRAEGLTPEEGYVFQLSHSWGIGVVADSLAETFVVVYDNPRPGDEHCPEKGRMVWVDLVTGAILRAGGLPCA